MDHATITNNVVREVPARKLYAIVIGGAFEVNFK